MTAVLNHTYTQFSGKLYLFGNAEYTDIIAQCSLASPIVYRKFVTEYFCRASLTATHYRKVLLNCSAIHCKPVTLNLDCPQIGSRWNEYFNFWPVILFHTVILGSPCVHSCLASKGKPHCYTKEGLLIQTIIHYDCAYYIENSKSWIEIINDNISSYHDINYHG